MLDDAARWADRLEAWEGLYKHEKEEKFNKVRDWYGNKFPQGLLTVNLLFSFGRAVVPQLYFKNPTAAVTIYQPGYGPDQLTLQKVDDRLLKLMKVKQTVKKMIVSAFCFSRGVCKVGYLGGGDTSFGLSLTGTIPHYQRQDRYAPERPYVAHIHTKDFAFDYQVSDVDDSGWFAMRFDRSHAQLKEDTSPLGDYFRDKGKASDNPDQMETFWEVWDKGTGKMHVMCEKDQVGDQEDFSIWPFYVLDFNWVPEMPLGLSDAELILDLQKEFNEIKTQIHDHRRTSLLKILAKKGSLTREAIAQLKSEETGPVVEVEGEVNTSIAPFSPTIPVELFTTANTNESDVRAVIGFSRNQLGETSPQKKTASEANIIQQQTMIRLDERRDMVADTLNEILIAVNSHVLDKWSPETAAQYGADPASWVRLQQVNATMTVDVVPDSTLPLSRQVKQEEARTMYLTLRDDPLIDQVKLRMKLLEAFETADMSLLNLQAIEQMQALAAQMPMQQQAISEGRQQRGPDQGQRRPRSIA